MASGVVDMVEEEIGDGTEERGLNGNRLRWACAFVYKTMKKKEEIITVKYMKIIYVHSGWRNEYRSNPRSNEHYWISSWDKAWKKFRPMRDLNLQPMRYRKKKSFLGWWSILKKRKNDRLVKTHILIRTLLGDLFLSFISIPFSFSRFQFIRNRRIVKCLEIQSY